MEYFAQHKNLTRNKFNKKAYKLGTATSLVALLAACGDSGDDEIHAGIGDDVLIGGAGADSLDGGNGVDIVSYASSGVGVTVDLTAGYNYDGL